MLPYLFELETDGQDMNLRIIVSKASTNMPLVLHSDFDRVSVNVLILVKEDTPETEIMDAINRAQVYWREQTEHS